MSVIGIDISGHRSKSVEEFTGQEFDYVITVCDHTKELCPVFPGQRFKDRTKSRGRRFAQPGMTFRNGLGCSHPRHRICTQSESESVKPVKLFSPDSLLDRSEFVGPVRQSPTIDIYTTDGVVARHTALYVGNLLTATLTLFRQWKIVFSICPNGSGYNFPPFF